MGSSLGALLDDARRRNFVGRSAERACFDAALSDEHAHRVMFVYGPGGIGKTTLLDQFRVRARDVGRPVLSFDGHDHAATREAISEAVAEVVVGGPAPVLLVDGYELLQPLDRWLRDELLPSLPASAVTVLAGRDPPATAWRTDPGWRRLVAVSALTEFDDAEAHELLNRAGVPEDHHQRLLELARGHPLALALLADLAVAGRVPDDLADAPDIVEALLPLFVSSVPDEAHAFGLEICAQTWVTTEALLSFALGAEAVAVWQWLASLPFVVRSPLGLHPHDLARDVLSAEYRRRAPSSKARVHRLLHAYGRETVRHQPPAEAHVAAVQLLYLHKDSPLLKGFWELRDNESLTVVPGRASDRADVVELVERFEGPDAAAVASRWLDAQGDGLRVVRRGSALAAFALEPVVPFDTALEADDAATCAVLDEVARTAPLRPGEQLSIGRFFGGPAGYQTDPHAVVCGSVSSLMTWQTRSLAWSWIVTVAPEYWAPIFEYLGFEHVLEIPGDRPRVAFGSDWRRIGFDTWLDVMRERELTGETGPMPRRLFRPPPLDRAGFEAGVREGLRTLRHPEELAQNPLMGTGLMNGPPPHDPAGLAAVLTGAIAEVGAGDPELHRVLDRTFLRATPSQEAAAEVLGLSFSTYRRRLGRAIDALTDLLWAIEIGGARLCDD